MTYTFMLGEVERCFTVYHPLNQNGALPVMFSPNCYAKDKLSGIEGLNPKSGGNAAAKRYGFARIGLSTPGIKNQVDYHGNTYKISTFYQKGEWADENNRLFKLQFFLQTSGAVERN